MTTAARLLLQETSMHRCAILDDYQDCALGFADWRSLEGVQVQSFTDAITNPDALV